MKSTKAFKIEDINVNKGDVLVHRKSDRNLVPIVVLNVEENNDSNSERFSKTVHAGIISEGRTRLILPVDISLGSTDLVYTPDQFESASQDLDMNDQCVAFHLARCYVKQTKLSKHRVKTGCDAFDSIISLQCPSLTSIFGEPASGKTRLALIVAVTISQCYRQNVLYITEDLPVDMMCKASLMCRSIFPDSALRMNIHFVNASKIDDLTGYVQDYVRSNDPILVIVDADINPKMVRCTRSGMTYQEESVMVNKQMFQLSRSINPPIIMTINANRDSSLNDVDDSEKTMMDMLYFDNSIVLNVESEPVMYGELGHPWQEEENYMSKYAHRKYKYTTAFTAKSIDGRIGLMRFDASADLSANTI